MGEPIRTRKGKLAGRVEHDARLCRVVQVKKRGRRKSTHLSPARKKSSLTMMKRNRKRKRTKRTGAKRRHIAGRAYDTGRGGSRATSKWQWARITLHAGFTKISLSQQNKFRLCWQQRGRRAERTNVKYDRARILDEHRDRQIRRLRFPRHSHSGWWIQPKRGGNGSRVCEPAETKEKAAEEGGTRREKDPARTVQN